MDNAASFFFSSGFSNKFWKREGFPVRLNTMMHVHDKQSYFIVNSGTSRFKKRCWTELVFSVFRRVGTRVRRAWEARVWDARERRAWEARVESTRKASQAPVKEWQFLPCSPTRAFASHALFALFANFPRACLRSPKTQKKNRRLFRSIQQRNEPYSKTVFTKLTLSAAIIIRVTFSLPDSLKMSASTRITALFL